MHIQHYWVHATYQCAAPVFPNSLHCECRSQLVCIINFGLQTQHEHLGHLNQNTSLILIHLASCSWSGGRLLIIYCLICAIGDDLLSRQTFMDRKLVLDCILCGGPKQHALARVNAKPSQGRNRFPAYSRLGLHLAAKTIFLFVSC